MACTDVPSERIASGTRREATGNVHFRDSPVSWWRLAIIEFSG